MSFRVFLSTCVSLVLRCGWAPVLVLILHAIVAKTPWRGPLDFWMHFSGGMAIAYFLFYAIQAFPQVLRTASVLGDYLFAFSLAAVVGLFWEFGELASDVFLDTEIQKSVLETLRDLIADVTGATLALCLVFLARRLMPDKREADARAP